MTLAISIVDSATFNTAMRSGGALNDPPFVLLRQNSGYDVHRPFGDAGRYIGHVECADDLIPLLADRCSFCAWPRRTGFLRESDQRTPRCDHSGLFFEALTEGTR